MAITIDSAALVVRSCHLVVKYDAENGDTGFEMGGRPSDVVAILASCMNKSDEFRQVIEAACVANDLSLVDTVSEKPEVPAERKNDDVRPNSN